MKGLFAPRYRIKKTSKPRRSGGYSVRYHIQRRYLLWPFWLQYSAHDTEKDARQYMLDLQWGVKHLSKVTYFYMAETVPDYISDEQKDRYLLAKEKDPKLKAIRWLRKEA